jgi:hypothetical protein
MILLLLYLVGSLGDDGNACSTSLHAPESEVAITNAPLYVMSWLLARGEFEV